MTDDQLHALLTEANPVIKDRAAQLPLSEVLDDLLRALLIEERGVAHPERRRFGLPRPSLVLAATAAVVVGILTLGHGSGTHDTATAWGAEQIRFADASPLVLLKADGWRVEYADEQSTQEGELHFRVGASPPPQTFIGDASANQAPVPADTTFAQLNWRRGPIGDWNKDRGHDAVVSTTAPVLGTTAHVFQYPGGTPGHRDITALFTYDNRVLEFRAGAADVDAFKALLAKLTRVDTDAWLSAMPASVVKTKARPTAIDAMLKGIPLPPGFKTTDIKGADLTKDRYQLGAAVSGTVTCQWFKLWSDARNAGDQAAIDKAIAAMATAKDWPVLKDMTKDGDYPEVLIDYANAMPSGNWYGRPLVGDVKEGLGCDTLGVDLG
jgi:hypothetical protein